MIDLTSCDQSSLDETDAKTKESKGLLRRAFSSRKKKKKHLLVSSSNRDSKSSSRIPDLIVTPTASPNYLSPGVERSGYGRSTPASPTSPGLCVKESLRAVKSNPITGGTYFFGDR